MQVELTVNGQAHVVECDALDRLLDVLRRVLGLTGSKEGCGEGECGACTVLIDGSPVNSCLVPVTQASGREIMTIEALADRTLGEAVQRALVQHGGTQCGICTPGVALAAHAALESEPGASRARYRELLAGNLCRCTGYQRILDAVIEVAEQRRASRD